MRKTYIRCTMAGWYHHQRRQRQHLELYRICFSYTLPYVTNTTISGDVASQMDVLVSLIRAYYTYTAYILTRLQSNVTFVSTFHFQQLYYKLQSGHKQYLNVSKWEAKFRRQRHSPLPNTNFESTSSYESADKGEHWIVWFKNIII